MQNWESIADMIAPKYNLKPATLKASVMAESSGNPYAISYVWRKRHGKWVKVECAKGMGQFTEDTGKHYGLITRADFFNPIKSMHAMAKKLSQDINTYRRQGDSIEMAKQKARIAYNCGPGCVRKSGRIPLNGETPGYLVKIARFERKYQRQELAEARRAE